MSVTVETRQTTVHKTRVLTSEMALEDSHVQCRFTSTGVSRGKKNSRAAIQKAKFLVSIKCFERRKNFAGVGTNGSKFRFRVSPPPTPL